MNFYNQSRYNRLFQKVIHRKGEVEINYINIFKKAKALGIVVGTSYSEDQLIHTLLKNLQKGGKYSTQIASHQA